MTHTRAQRLYPLYADGLLGRGEHSSLVRHLEGCDRCRKSYELLDRTMTPGSAPSPRLSADPHLPARIRALAPDRQPSARQPWTPALRWSFGSLAFTLALALGIYFGHDLSRSAVRSSSDDPISEFAASLSGSDLSDRWDSAVGQNDGGQP